MTQTRVLLVDDNEAWLSVLAGILQPFPQWIIIGEARDGLEAVQKSKRLQPDVIVMDVGLPHLNGFDAARQIRILARRSRILFLGELASAEAAAVALIMGASGYILKSEAAVELLPALHAVAQGQRFLSRALS